MSRRPIIAGNWKLNKTHSEARQFLLKLRNGIAGIDNPPEVLICPPSVVLETAVDATREGGIAIGAQNVYWESAGAFTGEISTEMLESLGVSHVLIGHSERRALFGESDEDVNRKLLKVLSGTLTPVVCVGEVLTEREAGKTEHVVVEQVKNALLGVAHEHARRIVLAYEPVWAIGTGLSATPDQANTVHGLIRRSVGAIFGDAVADELRVLYGGSVNPDNTAGLMAESDVDGVLVGGASLDAGAFAGIIRAAV
ncbi:triose-phosphate isomerase [bacterium]|nr:triose-phosphate isomerase [bacterium]